MSFRTITINEIQVIGTIWMPAATCAYVYKLRQYDIDNIKMFGNGKLTRKACARWLLTNSGDFQSITDFRADIGDFESEWESEESEMTFKDAMYGTEE